MTIHDPSWISMMDHGYPWCIMDINDSSWIPMIHHGDPWCIMEIHDASWISMMHHGFQWCIMDIHDAAWISMIHHAFACWILVSDVQLWTCMTPDYLFRSKKISSSVATMLVTHGFQSDVFPDEFSPGREDGPAILSFYERIFHIFHISYISIYLYIYIIPIYPIVLLNYVHHLYVHCILYIPYWWWT